ncbi:NDR1/HIN1-like protein 2 [Linum grandiflorum]
MEPATGYPVPPNQQQQQQQRPNGYPPPPPPSGTAYPYQAPQQPSNPYYHNNPSQGPVYSPPRPTLFRRLIGILIIVAILVLTALLITWIAIRPRAPEFRLTSLTLTNFNYSGNQLSGDWDARFEVYNPNKKMSVEYDPITSSVFYRREFLGETRLRPFFQQGRNSTVVEARYTVVNNFVDQWMVDEVDKEKRKLGSVAFDLRVVAGAGFKYGGFRARRRILRVHCDDLTVVIRGNGGSGNMSNVPKRCYVYA